MSGEARVDALRRPLGTSQTEENGSGGSPAAPALRLGLLVADVGLLRQLEDPLVGDVEQALRDDELLDGSPDDVVVPTTVRTEALLVADHLAELTCHVGDRSCRQAGARALPETSDDSDCRQVDLDLRRRGEVLARGLPLAVALVLADGLLLGEDVVRAWHEYEYGHVAPL